MHPCALHNSAPIQANPGHYIPRLRSRPSLSNSILDSNAGSSQVNSRLRRSPCRSGSTLDYVAVQTTSILGSTTVHFTALQGRTLHTAAAIHPISSQHIRYLGYMAHQFRPRQDQYTATPGSITPRFNSRLQNATFRFPASEPASAMHTISRLHSQVGSYQFTATPQSGSHPRIPPLGSYPGQSVSIESSSRLRFITLHV